MTQALTIHVPGEGYHRQLISCQAACPVHTDARGYVRAIAEGRFEEAYLIARGPNPFASICGRICGTVRDSLPPRQDPQGKRRRSVRRSGSSHRDSRLKRFVCDQFGPDARAAYDVLASVRDFMPSIAGDAEEMAALLLAAKAKWSSPATANGSRLSARGRPDFRQHTIWRCSTSSPSF